MSGAIIPDLPLEELGPWAEAADEAGVATVLLVAPSTPRRPDPGHLPSGPGASSTGSVGWG